MKLAILTILATLALAAFASADVTISAVTQSPTALNGQCFAAGASNYSYAWYVNGSQSTSGSTVSWPYMTATPYAWIPDFNVGLIYQLDAQGNNIRNLTYDDTKAYSTAVDSQWSVWLGVWNDNHPSWVYKYDALGNEIQRINVSGDISFIMIDKDDNAWLMQYAGGVGDYGSILKVNSTGSVLVNITPPADAKHPFIGVVDNNNDVYVQLETPGVLVMKFDTAGNNLFNISIANSEGYMAVDSNNNLFVATYDSDIHKYNSTGYEVAVVTTDFAYTQSIGLDLNDHLWAADGSGDKLYEFDNNLGSILNTTVSGMSAAYNVYADAENNIWIDDASGYIYEVNQSGDTILTEPLGAQPISVSDANGLILQKLIGGMMPNPSNLTYFNAGDSVVFQCAANGGGALNSTVFIPTLTNAQCVEDWTCGAWTDCLASLQTRTCTDNNLCGSNLTKPNETQSCVMPTPPQDDTSTFEQKFIPASTGYGIFPVMQESGRGLYKFFTVLREPLAKFMLVIGFIAGVVAILISMAGIIQGSIRGQQK
jgi:hypothetical protein